MVPSETTSKAQTRRWIACGLAMTLLPPLVILGCVAFDGSRGQAVGTTGLCLALAVGFVAVWQCPVPLWQKIVACLVYAPLMTALLFGVAVSYVCGAYDNCL